MTMMSPEFISTRPAGEDWRDLAECQYADTSIFYPEENETADKAKSICAICPVQQQCLETAMRNREREGVWGGLTANERRRLRRRRQAESKQVA